MISAKIIKNLRLETGAGVIDCKHALEEAQGDFQKAKQILEKGAKIVAQKKSKRQASQGLVECYCHGNKIGVVLELNCESDFASKTQEFKNLAHEIVLQITSMNPRDLDELLKSNYIRDESQSIQNLLEQTTAKIGENIQIKRFSRLELGE